VDIIVAQHKQNNEPRVEAISSFIEATLSTELPPPVFIFDVPITPLYLDGLLSFVKEAAAHTSKTTIFFVNIHTLNQAYIDHSFRQALTKADVVYCDGAGVCWGARLLGKSIPDRMTGADWIYDLARVCQNNRYRIYLLGGEPGVANAAAECLRQTHPQIQIIGTHHGYFQKTAQESEEIIRTINRLAPDILLVGFGSPIQETWISSNRLKLNVPVVWAMGATMDFVSGRVARAPKWMCNHSLEWLFRLLLEPRRMWRRYLVGNLLFFWRLLKETCR
jgi:N-acetylglucosaminyldiphosphoundecaprenol N-acetyl-beta-D-mannosaminyltransferase